MNKQELSKRLNEMLVGKSAYSMYKLCDYVRDHITDLGIDNTQGEWGVILNAYTLTLVYKNYGFVSFDIKRQAHNDYRWVVKQVVVEDDFTDYETKMTYIHNRHQKAIKDYDKWNMKYSKFEDLQDLLRLIKRYYGDKTKLDIKNLVHDLSSDYWLVDEVLESEGK